MVRVAVADVPFGVTVFGDMLQVVSAGDPPHVNATALVNDPPTGVIVSEYVAKEPDFTTALFEELVRLKSTPVPVKLAVCGVPWALSLTVNVPVRSPETVGAKMTLTVQLEPGASVAGQLLDCE
jgi:hypothetical protein